MNGIKLCHKVAAACAADPVPPVFIIDAAAVIVLSAISYKSEGPQFLLVDLSLDFFLQWLNGKGQNFICFSSWIITAFDKFGILFSWITNFFLAHTKSSDKIFFLYFVNISSASDSCEQPSLR